MRRYLLFVLISVISFNAFSQNRYNITGIVKDETGKPVKSATVFISGSEKVTISAENGYFSLGNLLPGNYQVSVSMLGYASLTKPVMLQNKQVDITLTLATRSIVLSTVKVGSKGAWAKNYSVFKEQFLGQTQNGRQCIILNPEVLSFGTTNTTLNAEAEDFLIIENKRLGYRIRYRLKYFNYQVNSQNLGYDGEASFEQMDAKANPKNEWAQNRLEAYNGSLMHF
ncbi:carboxypeptidase-like regulatory domain-containing protein [Mucilaginibacter antarcticus]